MVHKIAMIASIILPLWNIPLILRIVQRRSSRDVSLSWAFGVWGCLVFMLPAGLVSPDPVWKIFSGVNFVFFTAVVVTVLLYHGRKDGPPSGPSKS